MTENIFDLQDRVVVVTGGLGLLGRQFTSTLLDMGAKVAMFDLPASPDLKDFSEKNKVNKLLYFPVDIRDKESIKSALGVIKEKWTVPHGLINNAALDSPPNAPAEENGPFETYPETSWDAVMEVNSKGVFLTCQIVGGAMAEAQRGSIVNICSTYGLVSPDQRIYKYRQEKGAPFFKPIAYTASKSSLIGMTKYLATYFAPAGVRVNALSPHGVFNHQDAEFLKEYATRVPLGRMARADEFNGAITFLLSDASSYMTGSNLVVDGGWTAW